MNDHAMAPAVDPARWRSVLFVPVLNERYLRKAAESPADAIQLDLEDSILPADKARARAALPAAVMALRAAGKAVSVRINQPLGLAVPDLEAAASQDIQAVMLPKVLGPSHVTLLDELASDVEERHGRAPGSTRFIAVIETPAAYLDMLEIFRSSLRIRAAMVGNEDFARLCGCSPDEAVMTHYKQQMVATARAAGVIPFGTLGSIASYDDTDAYEAMVERSKAAGFGGTTCVHPKQVVVANRIYGHDSDALDHARRILAAAEQAQSAGLGAFSMDGVMVDAPVIERARKTLRNHRE